MISQFLEFPELMWTANWNFFWTNSNLGRILSVDRLFELWQTTFPDVTPSSPAKWRGTNSKIPCLLRTCHYPDLRSASDCFVLRGKLALINRTHYPDLGGDTSSVWNVCACSPDVISHFLCSIFLSIRIFFFEYYFWIFCTGKGVPDPAFPLLFTTIPRTSVIAFPKIVFFFFNLAWVSGLHKGRGNLLRLFPIIHHVPKLCKSRFSGSSEIQYPIKRLPNPALHFNQIPYPENNLSNEDPVFCTFSSGELV